MADQNNLDPTGWIRIFAGGILYAAGQWVWKRLSRTPRPVREDGHSYEYVIAQLRQMQRTMDGIAGAQEGIEHRLTILEGRRATGGD